MGDLIKKEFELLRVRLYPRVEEISEEIIDVQPEGFNNTIRWNLGHLLTVTEVFLFAENGQLPVNYKELFAPGTKPSDWSGEVPSVATLIGQLKEQQERINEIPTERFNEALPEPKLGCSTVGELAGFSFYHETYHFGQIHAMKRLIEASLAKSN
ncbi:DinB family protein [Bacillus sp. V3B]|uniref:DinB family protein n=1 Tax=Bacillus sp. V3B TaxID=2804915 RepID=UPI0021089D30|nr:DinB family protein [Bacillus sp. V3B]MCQ6275013.1 DinB family protein [Bacillus sp. V3B]